MKANQLADLFVHGGVVELVGGARLAEPSAVFNERFTIRSLNRTRLDGITDPFELCGVFFGAQHVSTIGAGQQIVHRSEDERRGF